jgi:hypothetical protein
MIPKDITPFLDNIAERSFPEGGFSEQAGSVYRPDTTAWAVMALDASGLYPDLLQPARSRLAGSQDADGRVSISENHPDSFWPTSLSVLAWHNSEAHQKPMEKAVSFLLETSGRHWKKPPDSPSVSNTEIPGWPWNEDAFSWIEPTSLSILALSCAGYAGHPRISDGVRLLMDRQLPKGGWNYGNTIVYGQVLLPQPDNTGIALTALASRADRKDIQISLNYLQNRVKELRTPRSLGWALLGLTFWDQRPDEARTWIMESLNMQKKFGPYDTTLLSLLMLAYLEKESTKFGICFST